MFWAGISGGVPEGEPAGFSGGVPPCPSGACPPGEPPFMASGVCPFAASGGVMPGVPPPIPPKVARVVPVWAVAAARVVLPVARVYSLSTQHYFQFRPYAVH